VQSMETERQMPLAIFPFFGRFCEPRVASVQFGLSVDSGSHRFCESSGGATEECAPPYAADRQLIEANAFAGASSSPRIPSPPVSRWTGSP
jgi:hypothetical protein